MGVIYKITNLINNKVYIGQTISTLSKRWREHRHQAEEGNKNYHLYQAMRKYGVENFRIEAIEQCPNEELNNREKFWIKYYDSFGQNGYNLTLGGDGADTIKHQEIFSMWDDGKSIGEIVKKVGYSRDAIARILSGYQNYSIEESNRRAHINSGKAMGRAVLQLNKTTEEVVAEYESLAAAERSTGINHGNISNVCNKKPGYKSAGGYKWKWKGE